MSKPQPTNTETADAIAAMIVSNLVGGKIIHPANYTKAQELVANELLLAALTKQIAINPIQ